jgi:hypothetical protein
MTLAVMASGTARPIQSENRSSLVLAILESRLLREECRTGIHQADAIRFHLRRET